MVADGNPLYELCYREVTYYDCSLQVNDKETAWVVCCIVYFFFSPDFTTFQHILM